MSVVSLKTILIDEWVVSLFSELPFPLLLVTHGATEFVVPGNQEDKRIISVQ